MADPAITEDRRWAVIGAVAADDKKATDTLVLEVGHVLGVTEYFIITSASNNRQVAAIAESIEEEIARAGGPKPIRIEGRSDATWILVDYGSFIAHVFVQETREYYDLERLWSDVPRVDWAVEGPPLFAEARAEQSELAQAAEEAEFQALEREDAEEQAARAAAEAAAFAELEREEAEAEAAEAAELAALEAELAEEG